MKRVRTFSEYTWIQLADIRDQTDVVLVPCGQVVEHGPHLPVGTDILQAEALCQQAGAVLQDRGHPVLVGPTISFGCSLAQEAFPGFVTINPETLTAVVVDVVTSLAQQGFRRQVWVLFGPSSWASIQTAAFHIFRRQIAKLYVFDGLEAVRGLADGVLEGHHPSEGRIDTHAGELETSLMLAIDPSRVEMERAITQYSELQAEMQQMLFARMPLVQKMLSINLWDWSRFGVAGVSGDARLATAEKGRLLLDRTSDALAQHVIQYVLERKD